MIFMSTNNNSWRYNFVRKLSVPSFSWWYSNSASTEVELSKLTTIKYTSRMKASLKNQAFVAGNTINQPVASAV